MIVSTAPFIAGHRVVETKGQTFGLVVRSRGFSGNLIAGLRSLGGGEIHEYTELLEDTRRQALDRLVKNATLMGANAVISMRFDSSELAGTMSEIVAYGTAVVVVPDADAPAGRRVAMGAARSRRDRRLRRPDDARRAGLDRGRPGRRGRRPLDGGRRRVPRGRAAPRAPALPLGGRREGTARRPGRAAARRADGALEPRFRPTAEVFVDPTTGHRMRVLVDPRTGERRYVAEG